MCPLGAKCKQSNEREKVSTLCLSFAIFDEVVITDKSMFSFWLINDHVVFSEMHEKSVEASIEISLWFERGEDMKNRGTRKKIHACRYMVEGAEVMMNGDPDSRLLAVRTQNTAKKTYWIIREECEVYNEIDMTVFSYLWPVSLSNLFMIEVYNNI
jgi:hypothetical protein